MAKKKPSITRGGSRPGSGVASLSPKTAAPIVPPWWTRIERPLQIALVAGAFALWFWPLFTTLQWLPVDEVVHVYVADQLLDGLALYRDVPSARPPLTFLPLVLFRSLGVPHLLAARLGLALPIIVCAGLMFAVLRRRYGTWVAVLSVAFLIGCPDTSRHDNFTGIQLTTLGAIAALLYASEGRGFVAGLWAGGAAMAGQHSVVISAIALLALLWRSPKEAGRYVAGGVLVVAIVLGLVGAQGSLGALWESIAERHLYHLAGQSDSGGERKMLTFYMANWFGDQLFLWVLAAIGGFWAIARAAGWQDFGSRAPESTGVASLRWTSFLPLAAVSAVVHNVIVNAMSGGLILYTYPSVPLLCVLAAFAMVEIVRRCTWESYTSWVGSWVLGLSVLTFVGWVWVSGRYEKRDEGFDYPAIPWLRATKMNELREHAWLDKLAAQIGPKLGPNDTVFGEVGFATPLAIKVQRRVSGQWADLVTRWFERGVLSRERVIRDVEKDHVKYIVTPRWFYMKDRTFRAYIGKCFHSYARIDIPRGQHPGGGLPTVFVFEHNDGVCEL